MVTHLMHTDAQTQHNNHAPTDHQRSNVTDVSHANVLRRDRWTTSLLLAEVWPDVCHFCLSVHLCACRLRPETDCTVQANWWRQNTSHMITAGERQVGLCFSVHCVILSIIQSDVVYRNGFSPQKLAADSSGRKTGNFKYCAKGFLHVCVCAHRAGGGLNQAGSGEVGGEEQKRKKMKPFALFRSACCSVLWDWAGFQPEIGGIWLLKLGPAEGFLFFIFC